MPNYGKQMHDLCSELFPICRSITGNGLRKSFDILRRHIPELFIYEVPSGTEAWDWTVPKEWNIDDAYIIAPNGSKFCEFTKNNLHVIGYSAPVRCTLSLSKLEEHLYSLPDQPEAIPYITSYYKEHWGFCLSQKERDTLQDGNYQVVIDSSLTDGALTYGEMIIPGDSPEEVLLSTYLCHPSMANNELSGPAVITFLVKWLQGLKKRKYTYRIVIIPETIGSIVYLSKNYKYMKDNTIAGFNLTCMGDNRSYSYLESRYGNTLADRVAVHVLGHMAPNFKRYSFLARGSDERQYCSPGVDLPVCSIMRTKYGEYPEYHTSLDDLSLISEEGLAGGFDAVQKAIECIEKDIVCKVSFLGEPQLGKRGLYPTLSTKNNSHLVRDMLNVIAYSDGENSLLDIAERINVPVWEVHEIAQKLIEAGVMKKL